MPDDDSATRRGAATREFQRLSRIHADCEAMVRHLIQRLDDPLLVAGFGSDGGEEFLSDMTIGDALVREGGQRWASGDGNVTADLNRIQSADGSRTGHHCITARTFCTASALLTLMVDRSRVVEVAKVEPKEGQKGCAAASTGARASRPPERGRPARLMLAPPAGASCAGARMRGCAACCFGLVIARRGTGGANAGDVRLAIAAASSSHCGRSTVLRSGGGRVAHARHSPA